MQSQILDAVFCENRTCKLNMYGSCQCIGTLLYFNRYHIPSGFYTCDGLINDASVGRVSPRDTPAPTREESYYDTFYFNF